MKVASVDNKNSIRDDTLTVEDSNAQKRQIDISKNGNNSYIDDVHQAK